MSREPLEEYKYKEKLSLKDLKAQENEVHKVACPSCSNPIPADNLNIQTNMAKCHTCDAIFSFNHQVEKIANQHNITQELLQPEGVELNRFRDELDITVEQPWGMWEVSFLSLVLPIIVFIVTVTVVKTVTPDFLSKAGLVTFWIASIVGVIAYWFARKKHKINIHIDDQNLFIERRPNKLVKDKVYATQAVDQVYIKNATSSATGKGGFSIFMIFNGREGQKHIELIKFVSNRSKAKYIEQEIERHLGIVDQRVPDEGT